jgi:hypothetical protein
MFKSSLHSRVRILLCLLLLSMALILAVRQHFSTAHATTTGAARYAFIVFLDGGHPELYTAANAPFLNSLKASGATYTNAQAQAPADSITNIMGAFTGTDATHHGFPYETFWDRQYNHLIELDETPVLPPEISQDRDVGRACTLFQAAKAAGLTTAFISKYPAYDVLDGPSTCPIYSGPGVDNLQTPTFADFTGTPQQYDQMNFDAVRAEINSATRPNIFGLYAVAPNTIMKQYGIDSPEVASIIQFEDSQIQQTVNTLIQAGIYNQTEIVIANDHGNTALTEAIPDHGPGSIDQYLNDNGIPTVQTTTDRVALVWLQNPSQAQSAINLLSTPQNMTQFGIQAITPASGLGAYRVTPQYRTPDFIVWPTDGSNGTQAVVYDSPPLSKFAEHGGRGSADQNILLLVEGPGVQAGYTSSQHVWEMELGSTVAADMCLHLPTATFLPLPGTGAITCGQQQACTVSSSIASNFNGTPIPAGDFIWFTSVLKVQGLTGLTPVTFEKQTIQFSAQGQNYTVNVPAGQAQFDPNASDATTTTPGSWLTTVPSTIGGNTFLSGVSFQVPSGGLPGGLNPVTWSGQFDVPTNGSLTVTWQWAAAVYTSFGDYDQLGVKPVDNNQVSQYKNSDPAGTPENEKSYVTGGARGGGGSNYTGGLSGTASVKCP